MFRQLKNCIVLLIFILLVGCSAPSQYENSIDYAALNKKLQFKLTQQQKQIVKLKQQIDTLRGFSTNRLENLITVTKVSFGRFTLPYDKNHDGHIDSINIYIVTTDKNGDRIKAAGKAEIKLWNLNTTTDNHLAGHWVYSLKELQKHWLGGFLADHYKFVLPWPNDKNFPPAGLTVSFTYKDALTGKTFEIQKLLQRK